MDAVVEDITRSHLRLLEDALPGRAQGLYITGSVALDDFHPPHSDIDAVVVLDAPLEDPDPLRTIHKQLPAQPAYDVFYLTRSQLGEPPVDGLMAPFTMHGLFDDGLGGAPVSPVLWAELARHAIAVREAPGLAVLDDHEALRAHTADNLQSYWKPWLEDAAEHLEAGRVTAAETELATTWPLFGVPRLHALLATGRIISKSETARYAAESFPGYAGLALRCLRHRQGEPQAFDLADARASIDLGREIVGAG